MRSLFVFGILCLLLALACPGCVSTTPIRADLWSAEKIPAELCDAHPELRTYGFYRTISETDEELVPYCSPAIEKFISARAEELGPALREATKPHQ